MTERRRSCRKCIEGERVCHRCPDLNGDVMPGCLGVATTDDLSRCTCPTPVERRRRLEAKVDELSRRVRELERIVFRNRCESHAE